MKKIFVIGSLNMDLVIETPRMPAPGETISGSGFLTNPGGKGANQTTACARLGGRVAMCGHVGEDAFGVQIFAGLERDGVDVSHVEKLAGASTGIAMIVVTGGENRIILDSGANGVWNEAEVEDFLSAAAEGDLLLAQAEIPLAILEFAFRQARQRGMYVCFNPAPAKPELAALLPLCDLAVPNETELALLTGEREVEAGLDALAAMGIDVIVTLGGSGCRYAAGGVRESLPCPKVKPVDTTAAGDTFCGGLCVRLAEGDSLRDSLQFALRAASLSVTRRGAQNSIPFKQEVLTK